MMAEFKAELRKLLTVRSTYILTGFALVLVIFVASFISGWRIDNVDLHNPLTLQGDIRGAIDTVSILSSIVGVLLVTHEYRYNTILYTLTASNNRNKVLAAKILVISLYALIFTLIVGILSPVLSYWGAEVHGLHLVAQTLPYTNLLWRCLFFGWGFAMIGLITAAIIRNQIGAIVTLLVGFNIVEQILGLIIKKNIVYLPFTALHVVLGQGDVNNPSITPMHALWVVAGYIVVGWLAAFILFSKRDALN